MRFKKGTSVKGLQPEMVAAFPVIEHVLNKHGQEAMLTSGTDGEHSKNSKHYLGFATDWRTWDLQDSGLEELCAKELQEELGREFYVKLHKGSHIHVQFNGYI